MKGKIGYYDPQELPETRADTGKPMPENDANKRKRERHDDNVADRNRDGERIPEKREPTITVENRILRILNNHGIVLGLQTDQENRRYQSIGAESNAQPPACSSRALMLGNCLAHFSHANAADEQCVFCICLDPIVGASLFMPLNRIVSVCNYVLANPQRWRRHSCFY